MLTCNEQRGIIIAHQSALYSTRCSSNPYINIIIPRVFWCTHNYSLPLSPIFLLSACARFPYKQYHPSAAAAHITIQSLFRSQQRSRHTKKGGELLVVCAREKCARCETRKIEKRKSRESVNIIQCISRIQCKAQLC